MSQTPSLCVHGCSEDCKPHVTVVHLRLHVQHECIYVLMYPWSSQCFKLEPLYQASATGGVGTQLNPTILSALHMKHCLKMSFLFMTTDFRVDIAGNASDDAGVARGRAHWCTTTPLIFRSSGKDGATTVRRAKRYEIL